MRAQVALVPDIPVPGEAAPAFQLPQVGGLGPWALASQRGRSRVLVAFVGRLGSRRGAEAAALWWAQVAALKARHTVLVVVALEGLMELKALGPQAPVGSVLLADPDGVAALPYGAWSPLFSRRAILVDGQGRVRLVQAGRPQPEAMLTYLAALHGDLPSPG